MVGVSYAFILSFSICLIHFDENFSRESIVNALAVWWQVKKKMILGMKIKYKKRNESL